MPGLINMHCHAADSLFRGLVENLPLEEWLGRVWIAGKAILTPETTYLGSVLGLAENLFGRIDNRHGYVLVSRRNSLELQKNQACEYPPVVSFLICRE